MSLYLVMKLSGNSFTYKWVINDFGNNEVSSEEYTVLVKAGITVGYFENFEHRQLAGLHLEIKTAGNGVNQHLDLVMQHRAKMYMPQTYLERMRAI